jgi:hypothetical protein
VGQSFRASDCCDGPLMAEAKDPLFRLLTNLMSQ